MAFENYPRLRRIVQVVSDLRKKEFDQMRVADLGCAHGYYALEFGRRGAASVGIEGRAAWIERANAMKAHLRDEMTTFHLDDARNFTLDKYGSFDVVLCLGLLYHLDTPDIFVMLENIAKCCQGFAIIDTQIAMQPIISTEWKGQTFRGWSYEEHPAGSDRTTKEANMGASLDDDRSFWLTRSSLFNALRLAGFSSVFECAVPLDNMYQDDEMRLHCDYITLVAFKGDPVGTFIGAVPNMKAEEAWPEDPKPFFLKRPYAAPWS